MRKEAAAAPAVPNNIQQLQVPDAYRNYTRAGDQQELFLLADSGVYTEAGDERQHR